MRKWSFAKGHGTLNDFVIVVDRHDLNPLSEEDVRCLTDRRSGVGGDGVLRVIKAKHIPQWHGDPELWFMDYRNADGSVAEMCGNGLRVFVRYLLEEDLAQGDQIDIATRAGLRSAWPQPDGLIRTSMGPVKITGEVLVQLGDREWVATTVDVGNPHAVVFLEDLSELADLNLTEAPKWKPASAFPTGVNVEFVVITNDGLSMRVYERGAGETMSCGTGVVAAAAANANRKHQQNDVSLVEVPGGKLEVELHEGQAFLTGPAVVIGTGKVALRD